MYRYPSLAHNSIFKTAENLTTNTHFLIQQSALIKRSCRALIFRTSGDLHPNLQDISTSEALAVSGNES